jgi:hypothetical protein
MVFYSLPLAMQIKLYTLQISNFLNYLALDRFIRVFCNSGSRYLFLIALLLVPL